MDLKREFELYFRKELENSYKLRVILYDIFTRGTAYIIGGYFRDFLMKDTPRDLDILANIPHRYLVQILEGNNISYTINRHNGVKVMLEKKSLDIWTFENNWAFKSKLVKLNEDYVLDRIARGCFYNYDALVINLNNFNYNLQYYNNFMANKTLDIFYHSDKYLIKNKTIEANILRALYINKKYNATFSYRTYKYLVSKIGEIEDNQNNPTEMLNNTLSKYPKYKSILEYNDVSNFIDELRNNINYKNNQLFINF